MEKLKVFVLTMLKNHAFQLRKLAQNVKHIAQVEGQVGALDHLGVQGQDPLVLGLRKPQYPVPEAEIGDQPEVQVETAVLVEISLALINS